jgi:Cdc6-like AAA superfamily ATPase
MIVIGQSISIAALILKTWLEKYSTQRTQCFILDVSPDGDIEEVVRETHMPDAARHDINVRRAPSGDDEAICNELQRFIGHTTGVQTNEVISELHPRAFPEVAAACFQLASRWFRGKVPRNTKSSWAFDTLCDVEKGRAHMDRELNHDTRHSDNGSVDSPSSAKIDLEHYRDCIVRRRYPRRPSVLLIAPSKLTVAFLSDLAELSSSWLSYIQVIDDFERMDECWKWPEPPDLVFSDLGLFKTLMVQGRWRTTAWIVASEDDGAAANSFFQEGEVDAQTRHKLPEAVAAWSPSAARRVVPLWVTRPLASSSQSLPSIACYQPTPEFRQARELLQTGIPKVLALVGNGGTGKTALAARLIEECVLTKTDTSVTSLNSNLLAADAVFVWDFYAEPFSEKFLKRFAHYLDPNEGADGNSEECLRLIRQRINGRNLRRILLVMDGLDKIQHQGSGSHDEGEVQDRHVLELLTEIVLGKLPIFALLTTRHAVVELRERGGDGFVEIKIDRLEPEIARKVIQVGGELDDNEDLDALAKRFRYNAMALFHLGRIIGDFYDGDTSAAFCFPPVEKKFQHSGVEEIDELNRGFIQLFARYEEHLPKKDLAVLSRLAVVAEPLSVSEFAEIFEQPPETRKAEQLDGLALDGLQSRFDALHGRQLLNIHVESGRTNRYATHPVLTYYFANALAADAEPMRLGARSYYQRRLNILEADQGSTHVTNRTQGAVRSRGAAVGPRGSHVNYPTNSVILDILERIIGHTVRLGRNEEARHYYQTRMGGEEHLNSISEQARANRISGWLEEAPL